MSPTLAAAIEYINRGIIPIPVPYQQKGPNRNGWQNLRIDQSNVSQYFNGVKQNIGALLGFNGSTDVDLDCVEARLAADFFLPDTGAIYGRKSAPGSHWLFFVDGEIRTKTFKDPLLANQDDERAMLLELRSLKADGTIGLQSLLPPSVHDKTAEPYFWVPGATGLPQNVDAADLARAAAKTAAAALLARRFATPGTRHEAFLALAATLARAGWPQAETFQLHRSIYKNLWPNEPESANCKSEVATTYEKLAKGEAVTGIPKLKSLLHAKVVDTA